MPTTHAELRLSMVNDGDSRCPMLPKTLKMVGGSDPRWTMSLSSENGIDDDGNDGFSGRFGG